MANAVIKVGDADSFRVPGLTSGFHGSMNVYIGTLVIVCGTLTLSQFLLTFRAVFVPFLELCVVVCIFDEFIERWVYFDGKNYKNF